MNMFAEKTDRVGYDELYKENLSSLSVLSGCEEYIQVYERTRVGPYYQSGNTKGFVRGEAIRKLIADADNLGISRQEVNVLDAGSGQGELSVYLACRGFNVTAVDISSEAKVCGEYLADRIGVADKCNFRAESLDSVSVVDSSMHFIIGHASLHHFIKYEEIPREFCRILKQGGKGYFADAFGENKLYHLFHNKERMRRLGDVTLTKDLIESYFHEFEVRITPTDWFVMLDKLLLRVFPNEWDPLVRKISRVNNSIDRHVSTSSRVALFLSGSVLTEITKRHPC